MSSPTTDDQEPTTPQLSPNRRPPQPDVFDGLPLLLPVPTTARLLGISRASAYRLAASGELPSLRLGGRVYIVTAELRPLVGRR